jgi:YidC/Oxa1 family membrane protein insertase
VLNFIYYPVSAILWFWHKVFGFVLGANNGFAWALSVMFLVFTLRAVLYKPFVGQVRSMRKMQEFAPQIKKLQAKYKDDKQKLAQEMQKLQSEHGVNPLGGCLPVLLQVPVFIGLFHVLREFQPWKGENYVFDRAGVESFNNGSIFGAKLNTYIAMPTQQLTEALGGHLTDATAARITIAIVAVPLMIVASIATHLTARQSVKRQSAAAAASPQTAIMSKLSLYIFPLGVLVGGPFFPMAILFYWLSNNIWTLAQQHIVYQRIEREEEKAKEEAIAQRQSLAPRPGQKPTASGPRPGQAPRPGQKPAGRAGAKGRPTDATAGSDSDDQDGTASTPADAGTSASPPKPAGSKPPGAKATGATAPGAKATGAKTPGAKTTGTKAPGAKTPGAKATGTKAPGAKAPGAAPASKATPAKATARRQPPAKAPGAGPAKSAGSTSATSAEGAGGAGQVARGADAGRRNGDGTASAASPDATTPQDAGAGTVPADSWGGDDARAGGPTPRSGAGSADSTATNGRNIRRTNRKPR